jgi:hypothetical protein
VYLQNRFLHFTVCVGKFIDRLACLDGNVCLVYLQNRFLHIAVCVGKFIDRLALTDVPHRQVKLVVCDFNGDYAGWCKFLNSALLFAANVC